jgi:Mrp family chromosome partitioning ATPase
MNFALRRPSPEGVDPPRVATTRGTEPVRREIAALWAVMLRLIDQHGAVVVYFTSVSHGEGTSTIARQLAIAAARSEWCKVAVVDMNSSSAGPSSESAMLGLLDGMADGAALPLRRTWFEDVELMEGALSGGGTAVPSVDTVRLLFDRLRTQFKLVVVDSPPITTARHAAAFSAAADCVVLVVEAERTRAADLERARATLEQLGANLLGIVLNKRRSWIPSRISRLFWGTTP